MQEGISGAAHPSGMEVAEGHLSSQVISSANQRGLFSACLPLALDISKVQPWQEEGSTVIARCQVSAPVRHSVPSPLFCGFCCTLRVQLRMWTVGSH